MDYLSSMLPRTGKWVDRITTADDLRRALAIRMPIEETVQLIPVSTDFKTLLKDEQCRKLFEEYYNIDMLEALYGEHGKLSKDNS